MEWSPSPVCKVIVTDDGCQEAIILMLSCVLNSFHAPQDQKNYYSNEGPYNLEIM